MRPDPSKGLTGNDKQVVGVHVCECVHVCVCGCGCACVLAGYWGSVNSLPQCVEYILVHLCALRRCCNAIFIIGGGDEVACV